MNSDTDLIKSMLFPLMESAERLAQAHSSDDIKEAKAHIQWVQGVVKILLEQVRPIAER